MSAVAGVAGLSALLAWPTDHLTEAADYWETIGGRCYGVVNGVWRDALSIDWQGDAAEALRAATHADMMTTSAAADQLQAAAHIARSGASDLYAARSRVRYVVEDARAAGFEVSEDLSVTDRTTGRSAAERAARQAAAQAFAGDIRQRAAQLVGVDQQVAGKITAAVAGIRDTFPQNPAPSPPPQDNHVRAVDHTWKQDGGNGQADPPPPAPPARGLPPEGLHPPVSDSLTPGPASRASEQSVGGQSLWDEHGGEWRYFPGDKWHNPHWDYNPHSSPNSRWDNIPINGLPPRIGDAPPIISSLPPWLQNPVASGAPGPPQNPLLAPFPGATMPAPSPGDLQTAGGETAVVGGGGLLLLILGAMALA
ncbi:hypothetical protein BST25_16925 [Mycobacterium heidelbergense]|uniref:Transmembrane protein n=1 Tax=Mycobacterium heidelbergense TaxID=53376 RepID=A0A1X0DGG4_MYCHE|nr:hypothetical protein [Mycobacterium heidelbergense]ORA71407.1 hypothetical protein BST25_16925 [Mycobacterium heidelbergense]